MFPPFLWWKETRIISRPPLPQGSALGAMVGQMTYGKRQWEGLDATMRRLLPPLHNTAVALIPAIDADTAAFNDYMVTCCFIVDVDYARTNTVKA